MRITSFASFGLLSAAFAVSACGGSSEKTQSSSTGSGGSSSSTSTVSSTSGAGMGGSDVFPAPHPALPQVQKNAGSVLATPKFVPVFFAGDDATIESEIGQFESKLGTSSYWSAVTSEYGVGAATAVAPVVLAATAPTTIDDSAIPAWINAQLAASPPTLPAPDANTVYVLHYPATTTITLTMQGQQATSCALDGGFGGYHQTGTYTDGSTMTYAVLPRCKDLGNGLTGINLLTGAESHELVEAATDPTPTQAGVAWNETDLADIFWGLALGGEVGDMCAQNPGVFVMDAELGFTVQRIWSNKSAAAGQDPCVPIPQGEVYFNAAPNPGMVSFAGLPINAVSIPVGQTKTVEVDLFSTAATSGPMTVQAVDYATLRGLPAELSFSWNKTTGVNGDKLQLSITATSTGVLGQEIAGTGASIYILESQIGSQANLWIGAITN